MDKSGKIEKGKKMENGKLKKLLLFHRLWGLAIGVWLGTLLVGIPLWVRVILAIPLTYFLIFGDSHFKRD